MATQTLHRVECGYVIMGYDDRTNKVAYVADMKSKVAGTVLGAKMFADISVAEQFMAIVARSEAHPFHGQDGLMEVKWRERRNAWRKTAPKSETRRVRFTVFRWTMPDGQYLYRWENTSENQAATRAGRSRKVVTIEAPAGSILKQPNKRAQLRLRVNGRPVAWFLPAEAVIIAQNRQQGLSLVP